MLITGAAAGFHVAPDAIPQPSLRTSAADVLEELGAETLIHFVAAVSWRPTPTCATGRRPATRRRASSPERA